jgi:hypothetical protein
VNGVNVRQKIAPLAEVPFALKYRIKSLFKVSANLKQVQEPFAHARDSYQN